MRSPRGSCMPLRDFKDRRRRSSASATSSGCSWRFRGNAVIAVNVDNYGADQLDAVMMTGRYSTLLASELDAHIRNRSLHSHLITDEIAALEGALRTSQTKKKRGKRFGGKWLKGLWHKHFFQP